jgi:flagellar biosynthesis anti-sigma factor FlgM
MEINDKTTIYPVGAALTKPTFEAAERFGAAERIEKKEALDEQENQVSGEGDQHAVVSISRASREAQLIKETLESEDGVRQDRISELKDKIDSGEYSVDAEKVAGKLVDDWLDEVF